ncbi:hypothetical protein KQ307_02890 [Synechococcus sp. CS-1326]|nr:hypothetical protein [Synechococcus sp. CS-1326]
MLTGSEVELLTAYGRHRGARPVGDHVIRAGIEARKLGHNLWQLRRVKANA